MRAFSYSRLALASARSAWKNNLRALMIPSHSDGVVANSSPPSRVAVPTWHHVVALVLWRRGLRARSRVRRSPRWRLAVRCKACAPPWSLPAMRPPSSPKRPFAAAFGRVRVTHRPDELSPRYGDVDVLHEANAPREAGAAALRHGPAPSTEAGSEGVTTSACRWLSKVWRRSRAGGHAASNTRNWR